MPQLDEDLVYAVCQHFDPGERRSAWLNVSRVCKTWHSAVTPLLYRSVDFAAKTPKSSFHYFVRTIAEQPSRAQYVNALNFCRMQMLPSQRRREVHVNPATWNTALNALEVSEDLRQRLERDLGRGGSASYAAKSALLLLLCSNLSRLGLTDSDLFDVKSRSPLSITLAMACSGSSPVLKNLVSITVNGAGLVRPEKLAVLLQLPKLCKLVTYNLANVSTALLQAIPIHSRSIKKFHYGAMRSDVWRSPIVLVDFLTALPCLEDLTLTIQLPNEDQFLDRIIWKDLCNALCEHGRQLRSLGVETSINWPRITDFQVVEGPSLKTLTSLVNLRIRCDLLSPYTPVAWDDPDAYLTSHDLVEYLSDMLPTSLQHLHLDEMAPYPHSCELPMHYIQVLHFLSDLSFAALQTFVFSVRQMGRQLQKCGAKYPSIPDELG
jgi:hypothetical protein